jgi:hypothetical protein
MKKKCEICGREYPEGYLRPLVVGGIAKNMVDPVCAINIVRKEFLNDNVLFQNQMNSRALEHVLEINRFEYNLFNGGLEKTEDKSVTHLENYTIATGIGSTVL